MTPITYVNNLSAHKTCTYVISPIAGGITETIIFNGKSYSEEDFKRNFPIDVDRIKPVHYLKGKNPDGTKEYLK